VVSGYSLELSLFKRVWITSLRIVSIKLVMVLFSCKAQLSKTSLTSGFKYIVTLGLFVAILVLLMILLMILYFIHIG
jgi:hypothetical protein